MTRKIDTQFTQEFLMILSDYMEIKLHDDGTGDWWDWTAGDQTVTIVESKGKIFRII